jgi:hypothetical protein
MRRGRCSGGRVGRLRRILRAGSGHNGQPHNRERKAGVTDGTDGSSHVVLLLLAHPTEDGRF